MVVGASPTSLAANHINHGATLIRLEIAKNIREVAMFNMTIDCKLRSCDMVKLLFRDLSRNGEALDRAQVIQQKTSIGLAPAESLCF